MLVIGSCLETTTAGEIGKLWACLKCGSHAREGNKVIQNSKPELGGKPEKQSYETKVLASTLPSSKRVFQKVRQNPAWSKLKGPDTW